MYVKISRQNIFRVCLYNIWSFSTDVRFQLHWLTDFLSIFQASARNNLLSFNSCVEFEYINNGEISSEDEISRKLTRAKNYRAEKS